MFTKLLEPLTQVAEGLNEGTSSLKTNMSLKCRSFVQNPKVLDISSKKTSSSLVPLRKQRCF